nr:hypothetical protein [Mycoplasmopsis bovis]
MNIQLSRFDSLFEKEVYDELTKRGWNVKRQIGYSDFKIDLSNNWAIQWK